MISLREQLTSRLRESMASWEEARAQRDEYESMIHAGEIESLLRIADDNGVHLPEAERVRGCLA